MTTPIITMAEPSVTPTAGPAIPVGQGRTDRPFIGAARQAASSARDTGASPFVPLLLLALAVVGSFAFATSQLIAERNRLDQTLAAQQASVDASGRVRVAMDSLATQTRRLADAGNPNARAIVDQLARLGITINVKQGSQPGAR